MSGLRELGRHGEQLSRKPPQSRLHLQEWRPARGAEQAKVANLVKSARKNVLQESPQKLVRRESHGFFRPGSMIFVGEGHETVVDRQNPGVGDRRAVNVSAKIFDYLLRALNHRLAENHPLLSEQIIRKRSRWQLSACLGQKLPPEQPR